jgi:two-component system CheB/CheR fusion protein
MGSPGGASGVPGGSFPVVGIGASAGGLEAFTELLSQLPLDSGMAFVVVQHLDPAHQSILPELLAKTTRMPVNQVTHGMTLAHNCVYVIPPNTSMAVEHGVLKLQPRPKTAGAHRAIDFFFESLARDQRERAIGVILSGTASDGTLGLEAIKAEGGLTFAQDASAKYDSMPRSAIAAGCVDSVLSPKGIARELARVARHPYVNGSPAATGPGPIEATAEQPDTVAGDGAVLALRGAGSLRPIAADSGFGKIVLLLRNHRGVGFSLYKSGAIERRIARRMVLGKFETLDAYAGFLRKHPQELEALYSDVLINVTGFFRNPEGFEALKRKVFAKLIQGRRDQPVRAWVVGCSTGQEAYSIAMAFTEFCAQIAGAPQLQIFDTDLNEAMLEKARAGLYPRGLAQEVSPERLRRFFIEAEGGYRISKSLREMCVFARQNLLSDPPFSRMDLVSCRNVLIYLEPGLQQEIIPTFHYATKPGGFLFLGASESVGSFTDLFEPVDKKHRIYAGKPVATPPLRLQFGASHPASRERVSGAAKPAEAGGWQSGLSAQREADHLALNRYAPPGVLINAQWQVLQFRGQTGAFLTPPAGRASFDLLKMAREGLLAPLRAALGQAEKGNRAARLERVSFDDRGVTRTVNLEVIPLKNLSDRCYLVCFEEADLGASEREGLEPGAPKGAARPHAPRSDAPPPSSRRVAALERELAETRDFLRSVQEQSETAREELQASGEEAQSANEELQSINEELETSKEELESANEELTTVNEEMASRNTELNRVNSELDNLHLSINTAILVLRRDLTIRRFTPLAEKAFNLLATDVGRPLGCIRHNLVFPDLEQLLAQVIDSAVPAEREVRDKAGRWFALRVRPFVTFDNKIDGAVLMLVDIDALKQTERALQLNESRLGALFDLSQQAAVLDEKAIIQLILEEAVRLTGSKIGYLHFVNEDQTTIQLFTWSQEVLKTCKAAFDSHYPLDKAGVWADAARLKKPVIHNDYAGLPEKVGYPEGHSPVIRHMSLPVVDQGKVRVILGVGNKETDYDEADVQLASMLGRDGWGIVSRKRTEEQLRLHLAVLESTANAIVVAGRDGVIQWVNPALTSLTGYSPAEAVGQNPRLFSSGKQDRAFYRQMWETMLSGRSWHGGLTNKRKDGSLYPEELTITPVTDTGGRITHFIAIKQDITQRKEAETKLAQTREALAAELSDMQRLHELSIRLLQQNELAPTLHEVLEASIALLGADKGNVHLYDEREQTLKMLTHIGFNQVFLDDFKSVPAGHSVCGTALEQRQRVIMEDAFNDPRFAHMAAAFASYGFASAQATPLWSREGNVIGVLSTHWGQPHRPSERELGLLDLYAQQAQWVIQDHRAKEMLRQTADQRRLALESGNLGTWDFNLATGEVFRDERCRAIFGASPARLRYEEILAIVHPEDRARVDRAVKQATSPDSSGACEIEYRAVWPDGTIHWVLVKGQAHFEGAGRERRAIRFIGTVMDISERKQIEQALSGRKAELERLVAERTAKLKETIGELEHFSYAIVHDMRAPLRAMHGFAAMLEEEFAGCLPPKGLDYFRRIQTASNRMDRLITDALQYSKIVRGELPLGPVDVPALLRGIIESYPNLQPPGAEIIVRVGELKVQGNEAALTQCFSNLLDNAVKFAKPGIKPKIRVWAEFRNQDSATRSRQEQPTEHARRAVLDLGPRTSDSSIVRIWVEDNGIGIPREFQARIFDLFQRGTNQQEGTGIGLAIVRKAMQRMGGQVGLDSEPGMGSRFWIELPASQPSARGASAA